jgi:fucose permease
VTSTSYRRDAFTWTAFGALAAFGVVNAVLGPALPYLRAAEGISYVGGVLHQVAFAVGGGAAGLYAFRSGGRLSRTGTIRLGLAGAAAALIVIGYGDHVVVTVGAALVLSTLATSALIALWAALSDAHGAYRTVAMTEGEVAVSLGSIVAPLLIGAAAATTLGWRFAFVIGAVAVAASVVATFRTRIPDGQPRDLQPVARPPAGPRVAPTLVVVFAVVALEFALSFWLASYLNDDVGLTRGSAVLLVSVLYAANLVGRLVASRLARRVTAERLLALALFVAFVGLPVLLSATGAAAAAIGVAICGAGVGATFPLTSSLHVGGSPRTADRALGEILSTASVGQILGPLAVAAIAQAAGLRVGLLVLPALVILAAGGLARHR